MSLTFDITAAAMNLNGYFYFYFFNLPLLFFCLPIISMNIYQFFLFFLFIFSGKVDSTNIFLPSFLFLSSFNLLTSTGM